MRYLCFICIILCFTGCFREGLVNDVELPYFEQKTVVLCAISTGDSVEAKVLNATPLGGNIYDEKYLVNNAQVIISEGNRKVNLKLKRSGIYSISQLIFPIHAGETYELTVQIPDKPIFSASCKVPLVKANFENIDVGNSNNDSRDSFRRKVNLRWKDVSTQTDSSYYLISQKGTYNNVEYTNLEKSSTEALRAGGKVYYETTIGNNTASKYYRTFYLITTESKLFQFTKATLIQENISGSDPSKLLTNFKGILPETTNIKNGLGFFGAFLTTQQTVYVND